MMLRANVREACRSLYAAQQRSLLALIGIVIGIGSVIAMISVGQIVQVEALKEFEELGTNILTIAVINREQRSAAARLALADALALPRQTRAIEAAAPMIRMYGAMRYAGKRLDNDGAIGVTAAIMDLDKLELAAGRFISDWDVQQRYGVVGAELAKRLRAAGARRVVGQQIKVDQRLYTIVGVLKPMAQGRRRANPNRAVYLPITTMMRDFPRHTIREITARIRPHIHYKQAEAEAQAHFRRVAPAAQIAVQSAEQLIESMQRQMRLFALLLGAIGSISLVVGGIGVMNVMLVSVVERRKEIGIRRALGARRGDIQLQFLIESLILSLLGGAFGLSLGVAMSYVVCRVGDWGFFVSPLALMLGVGVASGVGLFFGFYPARQAARLDPIAALRSE